MSEAPSLAPVHVPPDGGGTVFLVGDTYTTILSGVQTGGAFTVGASPTPPPPARPCSSRARRPHLQQRGDRPGADAVHVSPAGMEGMFAEIGAPGTRGVQGPPRSAADVEALIAVAAKYRFTIGG
jgi:hypothetical protein